MREQHLNLYLEPEGQGPLFLQVAQVLIQAIEAGRIAPGRAFPGVRELASQLDVHRNTIFAALREMEAQGWVKARPRSGFFVADTLPRRPALTPTVQVRQAGFELPSRLSPITDLQSVKVDLTEGLADARLAPTEALSRAYQRGLKLKGFDLLRARDFRGLRRLRAALAAHLSRQRGLSYDPDQLLIIGSTAMALNLVAQALIGSSGGQVAVEDPGNPLVRDTFRQASTAQLHPWTVDKEGVRLDALASLLKRTSLQLAVLTPQAQHPTGVELAQERRKPILRAAFEHRFPILELDPEYDYLPRPQRPLAAEDTTGQVIYVGSLSRIFAPGIRLGFLAAPPTLVERLARVRQHMDWQGDPLLEWSMSEFLLDGEFDRQLHRIRKAASERRSALEDALRHALEGQISFDEQAGAMALWLKGQGRFLEPERFDLWIRACGLKGCRLRSGKTYSLAGEPMAATRLGYTAYTPEELQKIVAVLAQV